MHMQHMSFTTTVTDKGYILVPVRIRKALRLRPKQTVKLTVNSERKIELEPLLTLDQVFSFIKPAKKSISLAQFQKEKQLAEKMIAENAAAEGL